MSDRDISKLITELKELKLRELQVLATLESILQTQQTDNTLVASAISQTKHTYKVGDQVIITNKVNRPLNRTVNQGDRAAIVTKVSTNRIDLRTKNGFFTWQAPHNIRPQTNNE
jgi:hypothetical protein